MLTQPNSGLSRVPYAQRCRLEVGTRELSGVLCNLSSNGVYVTLDAIPQEGEVVSLSFPLPGSTEPITVQAVVTWQNLEERQVVDNLPPGCGLRFQPIRPADYARIARAISEHKTNLPFGIGASQPRSGQVRVPYIQRSLLTVAGQRTRAFVCNLSRGGAYVGSDALVALNETVTLSFLLPGDPEPFESAATVLWKNSAGDLKVDRLPPGMGVSFAHLPPAEQSRLENLVLAYKV